MALSIGVVGAGKIARDQHLPAIAAEPGLTLAAIADPTVPRVDVPVFADLDAMLAALPGLDAVAICTPPSVRLPLAVAALRAGKHVLVEKPPTATLAEFAALTEAAAAAGRTLFATWHSRFNAAVDHVRVLLAGQVVTRFDIVWKEDVRRWHPGQEWIWRAGGFGVFDPGINALSILTAILPDPVFVTSAELEFPANRETPIGARLAFGGTPGTATFDWRQEGPQTWTITLATAAGRSIELADGGTRATVDGRPAVEGRDAEYPAIYRRFLDLIGEAASDADPAPLRLVADAFMLGRHRTTDEFHW
ncbi:MAG: Gfo/Idh/MocA family oxidoreductase [Alphaproteobacteria bacterium]|jgi:D-galactose 1-dehydrogenase|nr:Gfo/Idh/MocA family oxidoreductase [Alphaproteobacteria bacterium]